MSPATGRVLFVPQKNSRKRPVLPRRPRSSFRTCSPIRLFAAGGDVLEVRSGRIVVGDDRFLVAQVERLEATGQGKQVDLRTQVDDLVFRLGNPVGSRRHEAPVDGIALAEQLEPSGEARAAGHLLELLVVAELGGRKLVEIDGLKAVDIVTSELKMGNGNDESLV